MSYLDWWRVADRYSQGDRRRHRRRRPTQFLPGAGGLEDRTLLDGNVTVQLLQGSAFLVGDASRNEIQVDQAGLPANELRITGLAGTTIDDQAGPLVVSVTRDLQIDLKDGGDLVALESVAVARDVRIAMGNGPSNVVIVQSSTIGRDLTISTGDATGGFLPSGNLIDVESSTIGRDLTISTGDGTTTGDGSMGIIVAVNSNNIGRDLTINTRVGTATGSDTIGILVRVGNPDGATGNSIGRDLTISTGDGTATGNGGFGIVVEVFSNSIGRHKSITTGTSMP
jgi:hypothetical protein